MMMLENEEQLEAQERTDAAIVHAARRQIGEAVAALAVRPMDEPAAAQMRAALGVQASARAAVERLQAVERQQHGVPPEDESAGRPAVRPVRMTLPTAAVLRQMLEDPTADYYGFALAEATDFSSGTIYPILARLQAAGWLTNSWEEEDPTELQRPRRRMYRLTDAGAQAAHEALTITQRLLGVLSPGTRAADQSAIDSGHPDRAPKAAVNLGILLAEQGDPAGSRAAFQRVIDSGHPDHAPRAAVNLGDLLAEQGDPAGAAQPQAETT